MHLGHISAIVLLGSPPVAAALTRLRAVVRSLHPNADAERVRPTMEHGLLGGAGGARGESGHAAAGAAAAAAAAHADDAGLLTLVPPAWGRAEVAARVTDGSRLRVALAEAAQAQAQQKAARHG